MDLSQWEDFMEEVNLDFASLHERTLRDTIYPLEIRVEHNYRTENQISYHLVISNLQELVNHFSGQLGMKSEYHLDAISEITWDFSPILSKRSNILKLHLDYLRSEMHFYGKDLVLNLSLSLWVASTKSYYKYCTLNLDLSKKNPLTGWRYQRCSSPVVDIYPVGLSEVFEKLRKTRNFPSTAVNYLLSLFEVSEENGAEIY
ncbi:MAG: hypothetical protein QW328_07835, partial [Nitrososphaerota archaeon]